MEVSPNLSRNDELVAAVSNDALESFARKKPKLSDAAKIEYIYQQQRIDVLKLLATVVEDTLEYIKMVKKEGMTSILQSVIDSLEYAMPTNRIKLTGVSNDDNNTKAKKWSSQSHEKLTKAATLKAADQDFKVRLQMKSHPKKTLHSSVKEAKLAVAAIKSISVAEVPKTG